MGIYKEDFDKFLENLQDSMEFIRDTRSEFMDDEQDQFTEADDYTNVEFEDLENVEASGPNTNEQA